jgi:Mrp family chromosome partitioning ATPase
MSLFGNMHAIQAPTSFPLDHTELDHVGAEIARTSPDGNAARVMITGPGRGTGSSTLAWALAQRAVLEGQRVLFLDLDLLMPFTRHVLALDPSEQLQDVGGLLSRPWPMPGRSLDIACINADIAATANRAETTRLLKAELDALGARYDLIVADAAPVATRRSTGALDGCAIASLFDLTFVTILAGVTRGGQLQTVLARIIEMGGIVGGLVLNERELEHPLEGLHRRAKQVAARWPWTLRLLGLRPGNAF